MLRTHRVAVHQVHDVPHDGVDVDAHLLGRALAKQLAKPLNHIAYATVVLDDGAKDAGEGLQVDIG